MIILTDVTNPYTEEILGFYPLFFGITLSNDKPFYRRYPDSNWGIKDLQSSALPLGYTARNLRLAFIT